MTIDELQRLKSQANILVGRQENITAADKESYRSKWRAVAPRLLAICSCMLPRAIIKVKFSGLECKITGTPDGGFGMNLDAGQTLIMLGDQIQYVEKSHALTCIVYSKAQGICDPMPIIERGSPMMRYLLNHWTELEPKFIDGVADNLKTWAKG